LQLITRAISSCTELTRERVWHNVCSTLLVETSHTVSVTSRTSTFKNLLPIKMTDGAGEVELDCHTVLNDDYFESDFDDSHSVSSIDDKQGCSDMEEDSQQTGAEKLSDRQVLEAVNKLLKVGTFLLFKQNNVHFPWRITRNSPEFGGK